MGHSNGKITAPVSTDDVVAVLGETTHNIPLLCRSDKINPASKYKPIRGFSYEDLTADERRSVSYEDLPNNQKVGIIFGVRAVTNASSLTGLHMLDYSYAGKPGANDYKRINDFDGYDHYAKFLPTGDVEEWIYCDVAVPMITVEFDMTAGYGGGCTEPLGFKGISVDSIIKTLGGDGIASYYPCACIRIDGTDYIRALDEGAEEQRPEQTIVSGTMTNNGTEAGAWRKTWYINLYGLESAARVTFTDGMKLKVSIIFLPKIKQGSIDLENWTELLSIGLMTGVRAYGCPGAVNVETELRRLYKPGLKVGQPILNTLDNGWYRFSASVDKADSWSAQTYTVTVTIRPQNDLSSADTATGSHTFMTEGTNTPTSQGDLTLLGLILTFGNTYPQKPTGKYLYSWEVKVGTHVTNSGNGSFEIK